MLFAEGGMELGTVGTVISGVIVALATGYFLIRDRIIQSLGAEVSRLQRDNGNLHTIINELKRQCDANFRRIVVLETEQGNVPFAMWEMNEDGSVYAWANQKFVDELMRPRGKDIDDVIDKTHEQVWNEEVAGVLREMDAGAVKHPSKTAMRHGVKLRDDWPLYTVIKAVRMVGRRKMGMVGIAVNENDIIRPKAVA